MTLFHTTHREPLLAIALILAGCDRAPAPRWQRPSTPTASSAKAATTRARCSTPARSTPTTPASGSSTRPAGSSASTPTRRAHPCLHPRRHRQGKPTGLTVAPLPTDPSPPRPLGRRDPQLPRHRPRPRRHHGRHTARARRQLRDLRHRAGPVHLRHRCRRPHQRRQHRRAHLRRRIRRQRPHHDPRRRLQRHLNLRHLRRRHARQPTDIIFNRPQSIEIDRAARELVITDACNHRLGRFTLDGELIAWIGAPEDDTFRYPYGLLLLEGRQALVAEFGGNRLSLVDLDAGAVIRTLGCAGPRAGPARLALGSGRDRRRGLRAGLGKQPHPGDRRTGPAAIPVRC
jgi:hypothetical protein